MERTLEIEKLFLEDIREKRKAGSGAFHKKGKGIKHRMAGIRTAYDFMSGKEKRLLNGKVNTFNMYETILTKEEFLNKEEDIQKAMMIRWRELYPNTKIMDEMGISSSSAFHGFINRLDLPRKRQIKRTRKAATVERGETTEAAMPKEMEQGISLIMNGLDLKYNGVYNAEDLGKIFTKLQLLTEGEESEYIVRISIQEK